MKNDVAIEAHWKMAGDIWFGAAKFTVQCVVIMYKMVFGHFSCSFPLFISFALFIIHFHLLCHPCVKFVHGCQGFMTSKRFHIRQRTSFGLPVRMYMYFRFDNHWHIDATHCIKCLCVCFAKWLSRNELVTRVCCFSVNTSKPTLIHIPCTDMITAGNLHISTQFVRWLYKKCSLYQTLSMRQPFVKALHGF